MFVESQGFGLDSCQVQGDFAACKYGNEWYQGAEYKDLNANQIGQLKNVRQSHMIYDYCTDKQRTGAAPAECARNWYE